MGHSFPIKISTKRSSNPQIDPPLSSSSSTPPPPTTHTRLSLFFQNALRVLRLASDLLITKMLTPDFPVGVQYYKYYIRHIVWCLRNISTRMLTRKPKKCNYFTIKACYSANLYPKFFLAHPLHSTKSPNQKTPKAETEEELGTCDHRTNYHHNDVSLPVQPIVTAETLCNTRFSCCCVIGITDLWCWWNWKTCHSDETTATSQEGSRRLKSPPQK